MIANGESSGVGGSWGGGADVAESQGGKALGLVGAGG